MYKQQTLIISLNFKKIINLFFKSDWLITMLFLGQQRCWPRNMPHLVKSGSASVLVMNLASFRTDLNASTPQTCLLHKCAPLCDLVTSLFGTIYSVFSLIRPNTKTISVAEYSVDPYLLRIISMGANNCGQHALEKNIYFIMRFSPHFQLFYFNESVFFNERSKSSKMQIYFHSRLCSYLSRVPILMEGTVIAQL